jgi:hypothetical protein
MTLNGESVMDSKFSTFPNMSSNPMTMSCPVRAYKLALLATDRHGR